LKKGLVVTLKHPLRPVVVFVAVAPSLVVAVFISFRRTRHVVEECGASGLERQGLTIAYFYLCEAIQQSTSAVPFLRNV
jgi:hypothetical protein